MSLDPSAYCRSWSTVARSDRNIPLLRTGETFASRELCGAHGFVAVVVVPLILIRQDTLPLALLLLTLTVLAQAADSTRLHTAAAGART
jgi:hypothetical protein